MKKKKVVIIGAGFGGIAAALALDPKETDVVILDQRNHHLFQPLLYQVATSALSAPDIAKPIRCIMSKRPTITTYMEEVTKIDLAAKKVSCTERSHAYDYLIIAVGAKTGYFGNNHWAKYTHGLKNLDDALGIRKEVLGALEKAEMETDPVIQKKLMTIVLVGGGPTGVEMAGALAELGRMVLTNNFRHIDPAKLRVILIEAAPRLLTPFPEKLSQSALKQIQELGVEIRLNTKVKDILEHQVVLENETIETSSIIWAAGVEAVPITRTLGVPTDPGGRLKVEPDCSLPGYAEVFAIGDCVRLVDRYGTLVPGVSPGAIQMGEHVARLIDREISAPEGQKPTREPFGYFDKGSMATIGRSRAVVKLGPLEFSGKPAWLAWLLVHLLFLVGFRNKVGVLLEWIYSYVTFKRGARIILD